jgi:hypothetical protein
MGVHLYCIVPAGCAPPAALAGVGGAAVATAGDGALLCWLSEHASRPVPTVEHAAEHHAVVQAVVRAGVTPVPLRFGQWFATAAAAAEAVGARGGEWAATLRRVHGCVEYGVRIEADSPSVAARDVRGSGAGAGTEYMQELARVQAQDEARRGLADGIVAYVAERAGPLVRAAHVAPPRGVGGVVELAHLVTREDEEEYRKVIRDVASGRTDVRFLVTGPWPPWSFA